MTVTAISAYPAGVEDHGSESLSISDEDPRDAANSVRGALLCYGVRGHYESLGEAVQALGRRAEAAETAAETVVDADPDLVLGQIVTAIAGHLDADPEVYAILAARVWRSLSDGYRFVCSE